MCSRVPAPSTERGRNACLSLGRINAWPEFLVLGDDYQMSRFRRELGIDGPVGDDVFVAHG
jgi:hypothetical protein